MTINQDINSSNICQLKFLSLNVCGLVSKSNYPEFLDLIGNYGIIGIQESKTDACDSINIPGYNFYFNNRENLSQRKSGGIVLLVKKELQKFVKVESRHNSNPVLWCTISRDLMQTDKDVYCGIVYIPPIGSRYANEDPYTELQAEILRHCTNSPHIILMGDYNSRTGERDDIFCNDEFLSEVHGLDFLEQESNEIRSYFLRNSVPLKRANSDKIVNAYGTQMIDFCRISNLCIINGRIGQYTHNTKYTCKDRSVIDYFLCTPSLFDLMSDFCVLEFSSLYSDAHCPISLAFKAQNLNLSVNDVTTRSGCNIRLWNHEKGHCFQDNFNINKLQEIDSKLSLLISKGSLQQSEMDDIVLQIGQAFEKCAEASFGHIKQVNNKSKTGTIKKPWFKEDCHRARNLYHNARRRYNTNRSEQNKLFLRQASKFYKSTMNLNIKKFKNIRIQKLRSLKTANPREFWKILNSSNPKNVCQAPLQELYNYFKGVNDYQDSENTQSSYSENENNGNNNAQLNRPIDESEVREAIKQLKQNKSTGSDNIKNEHIKSTSCQMIPVYTKLFNLVFDSAIIPESWSVGVIKPIYKKGDPCLPQNYRPITILSCLGKLFTSVINNRLKKYDEMSNVIEPCQAGFRKNHSTADNIFIIKTLIDIVKAKKSKLFGCFVDFKQAFDTVWRNGLWHKLNEHEINGKCLQVIQSIYSNVKSKVMTEEGASIFFPCLTGVRRGENLSPFLFSIFVNDLNHFLMSKSLNGLTCEFNSDEIYIYLKLMMLLYADDTVLFMDSESDMQCALDAFKEYCHTWRLTVNLEKTKIVVFSGGETKSI